MMTPYKTFVLIACLTPVAVFQARSQDQKAATKDMKPAMTEYWEPKVKVLTAGTVNAEGILSAPSDATVLFDGKDLSKWKGKDGGKAGWDISNGVLTVNKKAGDIQTIETYGDFQLHIEWRVPAGTTGEGQSRGNSGVFLQGIYELQILDSYENATYANGQAGSIYKQTPPLRNAMRPPGVWNVYDILYTAPRFKSDSTVLTPAQVTVMHNGVVIQHHTTIKGTTPYVGLPEYNWHGNGPIILQSHNDPSPPISFRNIWIRNL